LNPQNQPTISTNHTKHFLFTVDVEDWFQVENFKTYIPHTIWDSLDLRVERNTHKLLDLFDEFSEELSGQGVNAEHRTSNIEHRIIKAHPNAPSANQLNQRTNPPTNKIKTTEDLNSTFNIEHSKLFSTAKQILASEISGRKELCEFHRANKPTNQQTNNPIHATFFILGWVAERLPGLVREIHKRGHEVASHGVAHELCNLQSPQVLQLDLQDSKKLLEDIISAPVCGYRAPSFSISNDVLSVIEDAGYLYDASYNSFDRHGRYGKVSLNGCQREGIAVKVSKDFYEIPISNLSLSNSKLKTNISPFPWGGGGYFRLIPYFLFRKGVQRILEHEDTYSFYCHPWELDPNQPRVNKASRSFKFRHYVNLASTEDKIKTMLDDFRDCKFVTCREYLCANTRDNF
jgi:polysaccharide deacetylase family protein (PEP-CTERM system associated)